MNAQLSLDRVGLSKEFLLAGRAIFTVVNPKGERYTFRIKKKVFKDDVPSAPVPAYQERTMFFVQLLTGPENTHDYTYVGVLQPDGHVALTSASRFNATSVPYRVADWVCRKITRQEFLPAGYEVLHAGRCGRCGRLLTVPESIKTGLGPECAGRV